MGITDNKQTIFTAEKEHRLKEEQTVDDGLLKEAETIHSEQQALLESSSLEVQYGAMLASYIDQKHGQVERIEDRLEVLIEQQSTRIQQATNHQPGLFALPGKKAKFQSLLHQEQSSLQRLHGRLETVREIKESMGLHSPRIEEMATRKMRIENPELTQDWDEMREAQRRHEAMLRKKEQDRKQDLARSKGRTLNQNMESSSSL